MEGGGGARAEPGSAIGNSDGDPPLATTNDPMHANQGEDRIGMGENRGP